VPGDAQPALRLRHRDLEQRVVVIAQRVKRLPGSE
jgi:hypothetical protein